MGWGKDTFNDITVASLNYLEGMTTENLNPLNIFDLLDAASIQEYMPWKCL